MWLDRLGNTVSPVPPGRSFPQAQRVSSSQNESSIPPARPLFSPRSSSLGISSNTNASTVLSPGLVHQGQTNSIMAKQPPRTNSVVVRDPLEVLQAVLGKREGYFNGHEKTEPKKAAGVSRPKELVDEIYFGDLSLEEFVEKKWEEERQESLETLTIEQFQADKDRFKNLHEAVTQCDKVLKSVETYLESFQTDLGVVSAEIESVQSRSIQMNSQLENRRNLERLLHPAVECVSISPIAVRSITEGPISSEFVKALNELESRSKSIQANVSSSNKAKAVDDVQPILLNLKDKAVERIRDYLVSQIKALRAPNINSQIIQQRNLLKYREIYPFLSRNHPILSDELLQAYANTMLWYYTSTFSRYLQSLGKIKLSTGNELLGNTPNFLGSDKFVLGRRMDILKTSNTTALSSYAAEEDKAVHGTEIPFRNYNLALIDNVCAEFSFMTEMFSSKPYHQISRKVIEIFDPVFSMGQNFTKTLVDNCTDCLGILLCIRLNQRFAFELQHRKVPVADPYINGNNMTLWPRFQMSMDQHCESLRKATASLGRGALPALSLSGGDKQSTAPHMFTQRFGQFMQGIMALTNEAGDDEPVSNSLARVSVEFDSLLAKLSKTVADVKKRERFLFNNYSLILTIIGDTQGKLAREQKEHYDSILKESMRRA